jgi:DNA-binding NtrC family response regulator
MPEKDVLIVDDDAGLRDVLADILQDNGYEVDQAGTVAEAKQLLDIHRYGVIFVEWRLPDGDGAAIANLALEIGSYAFVISGYLRGMLPGNIDPRQTIMKPIKRDVLLATVRICISATSTRNRLPSAPALWGWPRS